MEYNITNLLIHFKTFEGLSDRFVHCYTRGYDDSGKDFDFTRKSKEDDPRFMENIRVLGDQLGFKPSGMAMVLQMHTDLVKKVTHADTFQHVSYDQLAVWDAMITNCKGVILATKHADCVPVYMIDVQNEAIGLAHSGWKGTLNLIAPKTAEAMKLAFHSDPSALYCVIGPSICADCYEIQEDVYHLFTQQSSYAKEYIKQIGSSWRLDLKGFIRESLIRSGFSSDHIQVCDLCTGCNKYMMYSHRKSKGNCGRSLAVLGIRS